MLHMNHTRPFLPAVGLILFALSGCDDSTASKQGGHASSAADVSPPAANNEVARQMPTGTSEPTIETIEPAALPGLPVTGEPITTASGLRYYDMEVGTGATPPPESRVRLHYTGYRMDGTEFDTSLNKPTPVNFHLKGVIEGWKEGVGSMRVGGKRKLIVPGDLAFGPQGIPVWNPDRTQKTDADGNLLWDIAPNATVVFDVELIGLPDQMDYQSLLDPIPGWKVEGEAKTNELGIMLYDLHPGTGELVDASTFMVEVLLTGYLNDGTNFLRTNETPTRWTMSMTPLGIGEGLRGMREGGKRKLILTGNKGYGRSGINAVPANAILIIDMELTGIFHYDAMPTGTELPGVAAVGEPVTTESGLVYYDLEVGTGPMPAGRSTTITAHYVGWLLDGIAFDGTDSAGEPAKISLANARPGMFEGVSTMRVGGIRKLVIPYALAFGELGVAEAGIPPRATLVFDIQLLGVEDGTAPVEESSPPTE
jgi:peptidylprolyl isomerase